MIYIHEETGKMVNIYAPFGGFYRLDTPEIRIAAGVVEIEPDQKPPDFSEDFYTINEDWEATQRPYIIYKKKSDEQIAEIKRIRAINTREQMVADIKVTTASGKVFDGDEVSQGRISRTIQVLEYAGITKTMWVLADNAVDNEVTVDELKEALLLAGQAQTNIWALPYL